MDKKGFLQISFAWLFAILVGAVILFLAIFLSTKLIRTEQTSIDAQTGKEIGILLNPLETSFESGTTTSLRLPIETRIYNKCNTNGVFGKQIIQISQKSFNKWTETDIDIGFSNKYLFSEKYSEGKKFYIFSKPFNFPFKVADLIYITPALEKYCFINAPDDIKKEILDLNQENLLVGACANSENIEICFNNDFCDINVNYGMKYVEKNNKKIYFEGDALMYAAVFANPEIYECQLKRLMQRVENLALIYRDKAMFISGTGCHSNLNLLDLVNAAGSLSKSEELTIINNIVEEIKEKNDLAGCALW
jgi:hypothetical protein